MKMRISVALAAVCLVPARRDRSGAAADPQRRSSKRAAASSRCRLPPGGAPPRMADGKVDLSGVWFPGPDRESQRLERRARRTGRRKIRSRSSRGRPTKIKSMSRTEVELLGNANVQCLPPGTPGMMTENPYVHQIITKPGQFVHLIENNNRWRVVHTDGRPHKPKEDQEPLFNGDMVGKWEGDTLVIDTISIDERTWIRDGWFHSDELHVIERFRRPSMNYLEHQFTIEDPKVLTKPWTSAWRTYTLSVNDEDLTENFCTNNEQVEQFQKLLEQSKRGKK